MPKQKILITGGAGLLGSVLSPFLIKHGFAVVTQSRSSASDVQFDLCDTAASAGFLDEVMPEAIVNLVALTNVDRCEEDIHTAFLQNVRTVENLVAWIQRHPATKLLHISTDQVYDGAGSKKESEITIRNVYTLTKYCSELAASKVGATVLRTNFFGKSLRAGRTSLSDWVIQSLRDGAEIKLFSDIYFSPLSMRTLSELIEKVLERPLPGIYNLGSHEGMSKSDFALRIADAFHLSTSKTSVVESTTFNFTAQRPRDMRMDSSLFESSFGVALPTLREEIARLPYEYGT